MKAFKWLTGVVILLAISIDANAQDYIMDTYIPGDPQVWSFIKYGGDSPDLYTGTVRQNIPLYTYKDRDFEIPISLSYASNGYMPNIQANFVGLGWTLTGGGVVSRRVQGVKDEGIGYEDNQDIYGFHQFAKNNTTQNLFSYDKAPRGMYCYRIGYMAYETLPDIYMFNFPGHHGRFTIDEYGNALVFDSNHPSGEYKIDLSSFDYQMFRSELKITTGDGYVYEFGGIAGNGNTIRTRMLFAIGGTDDDLHDDDYSDDWQLKRIIAPNGRSVVYSYDVDNEQIRVDSCHPFEEIKESGYIRIDSTTFVCIPFGSIENGYSTEHRRYELYRRTPFARLSSITVLDKDGSTEVCKMLFTYGTRDNECYKRGTSTPQSLVNPGMLTRLQVVGIDENTLFDSDFTYTYTGNGNGNPVLLLQNVHIAGLGNYTMSYYGQNKAFPYHGTVSIDHWGYWNKENSEYDNNALLPEVEIDVDMNRETLVTTNRNPNAAVAVYGLLKQINYPTGGWTSFEYEGNDYRKIVIKDGTPASQGYPVLEDLSSTQEAGGVRIKRITDYVSETDSLTREFQYVTVQGESSGIMYNFPHYQEVSIFTVDTPDVNIHFEFTSKNDRPAYLMEQSPVAYSRIIEKYADNSCISYSFTDYSTNPDDLNYGQGNHYDVAVQITCEEPVYGDHYFRKPQSLSHCRGKMLSKEVIGPDGNTIEKTQYSYSALEAISRFARSVCPAVDSVYIYKTFAGDYPLINEVKTEYGPATRSRITSYEYDYNSIGQLAYKRMTGSDGSLYEENNVYVKDLDSQEKTAAEDTLLARNILSPVLYHTIALKANNANYSHLISGEHYSYGLFYSGGRQYVSLARKDRAYTTEVNSHITRHNVTWKPETTVLMLDSYGRPMEVADANGVYSVYLWGYGGLYPVAELRNCRVNTLSQKVHANLTGYTFGWTGIDDANASYFRKIPGVSMTSWKYSPLAGVTSKTDPSGRTTTYGYNAYGRLISVTGSDGNLMQEYDYSIDTK